MERSGMSDRRDIDFGKGMEGAAIWAAFRRNLSALLASALPENSLKPSFGLEDNGR